MIEKKRIVRDRSFITWMGAFTHTKRGRGGIIFSPAGAGGGGAAKSLGRVLTSELAVLAIPKERHKRFPFYKRGGGQKVLPCLKEGGAAQSFRPETFPL